MAQNFDGMTAYQVQFTSGGVATSTTMYSSSLGTYGPARGLRWYTCAVCGFFYPQDRVVVRGGAAYCYPNMCYLEMDKGAIT